MPRSRFTSPRKAGFDLLLQSAPTPSAAVRTVREWEHAAGIGGSSVYVSTAITSGGFQRGTVSGEQWAAAKARNEVTAGRLYQALAMAGSVITDSNGMIPTELGKVPSWTDMDYMLFYLAYATGLSDDAASSFHDLFVQRVAEPVVGIANNRALGNDERWPSYLQAITTMLACLDDSRRRAGSVTRRTLEVMLQLVDTGHSLGCRAEEVFAQHESLDILIPALNPTGLPADLAADIDELTAIGVSCGRPVSPALPIPKMLNSTRLSV